MPTLQDAFRNGVEGYTPATMWFTSGNINLREMTRQLEGFRARGIRDFFIHPSSGTQGDYMGPYFFRMIGHAAREAQRLGMNFWIYDEYNWPSGVAAGQVLAEAPWANSSVLSRTVKSVGAGETVRVALPEKVRWNTKLLLCTVDGEAVSLRGEGDSVSWYNPKDRAVTLELYFTSWTLRKMDCTLNSEVVEKDAWGYLDTMDPEAVQVFIRKTHEVYKQQIGEYFGKSVKGIFTDEAALFPLPKGETRPELPWSRLFEEKFLARNGYSIRPKLKQLMDHTDPKLTVDYWETVTELFMHAYMDQISQWCEENDLIYTGHLLGEENIDVTVDYCADPYEYYKRFHMPGVDSILTYYFINDYNYNIAAKRAASAARFLHKERLLCETFTISGWEIRLRDMKRIINRLTLLGVNFLQYMGSAYEFMPANSTASMTNNWQNPLFRHYGELSKYISGLQWLVANTVYEGSTLLLYPMTTARVQAPTPPEANWGSVLNDTLNGLVNSLLSLQVPFEFAFEQLIDEAEIGDGCMILDGSSFDRILLPCTVYLKEKTFRKLRQFGASGGKIIAVNGELQTVIGRESYAAPPLPNTVSYECYDFETVGDSGQGNSGKRTPMGAFTEALRKALGPTGGAVKLVPQDGLLSAVRRKDESVYVLLVNDTQQCMTVEGENLTGLPMQAVNTQTGDPKHMRTEGTHFALELSEYECAVLELPASAAASAAGPAAYDRREIPLCNVCFSPEGTNTALPDMWQVRGEAAEAIVEAKRVQNPRRLCQLAEALTERDIVLCRSEPNRFLPKTSKRDWFGWTPVDGKKPGNGETVVCIYDFTVDTVPPVLELISDPQLNTQWYLNDEQLYPSDTRRVWHYANPVFDLGGIAVPGKNRLIGICTYPAYDRAFMLPCAVLKGDFRFFGDHVITQRPGGNDLHYWNDQGYRCHTGDGSYRAEFTVSEPGRVVLELESTDVVEVYINGVLVAKRLWEPYSVDLTDHIREGVNFLMLRVTGTLSNFLFASTPSGVTNVKLWLESDQ